MNNGVRINLFNGFTLDLARECVIREGERVHLRRQAYEVLRHLVENKGSLITKDKLIEQVWQGRAVTDSSLVKCIEEVRQALGPDASHYVQTVRGRGYIFDTGIERPDPSSALLTRSDQVDLVRVTVEEHEEFSEARAPKALLSTIPARLSKVQTTLIAVAGVLVLGIGTVVAYNFFRNRANNSPPITSIAVLPFKNESGNADVDYLSDGITESLINSISQLPQLSVKARSTVFRYKGQPIDPQHIASKLSVQAIVEGRVVQRGDDLTLYLALVDGRNGNHIWGRRYDRRLSELLTLQSEIERDVSQQLRARISVEDERKLAKKQTQNVEAYQLYLRGRYHALKRTLPETEKAISYLQQAIALDPSYALAYAGLADAYVSALAADLPANEFLPQARAAAQKAIEIDDTLAAGHAQLGFVIFWYDWDWSASENEFKRALALDPDGAETHLFYAHLLSNTGRHAEALAEVMQARELDPLNMRIKTLEGQFLTNAGRTDEALTRLRETLEMDPNYYLARLCASSAYTEKGMYAEAVSEAQKAREIAGAGSTRAAASLGYALAKLGKEAEARSILEDLLKSSRRYVSPYGIALVYNGLGKRDEALTWLERAYAERHQGMVFLKVEPKWNSLRPDPRFQNLMRRVGFPS